VFCSYILGGAPEIAVFRPKFKKRCFRGSSDSFAEYARRCGETTERGVPSVVGALLSDSFAEYVRFCVWFSFLFLCFGVISCVLFIYTWRSA
jgi:hypothetical protein